LLFGYNERRQTNKNFDIYWDKEDTPALMGLLLDLDSGTLTGYLNGELLWKVGGITGHYCWAVALGENPRAYSRVHVECAPFKGPIITRKIHDVHDVVMQI